tara:strand:- start:29 stop:568 length:540 start_codon:yes stop_codon:yes gene_type:complete
MKIIEYPGHIVRYQHKQKLLMNEGKVPTGKFKGKKLEDLKKKDIEDIKDSEEYAINKVLRNFINKQKGGGRIRTRRRTRKLSRRRKRTLKNKPTLYYFSMEGCFYCDQFNPLWIQLVEKYKGKLIMKKIVKDKNPIVTEKFNVTMFPTIILEKNNQQHIFQKERTLQNIHVFLKKHKAI